MTPILLATRSHDKLREIRQILAPTGLRERIVTLDDVGVAASAEEDHIEIFDTFLDNARAKAAYFARHTGMVTVSDDSGICVDALDGRPGVRSRRFSGRTDLTGSDLDRANNEALLAALARTPGAPRGAAYVCAAVCRSAQGQTIAALGSVRGHLLESPRGSAGFGYDPLFLLESAGRTFGELSDAEKHRHSHRARAFRALATVLSGFLQQRRPIERRVDGPSPPG